jgi:hypothetical protein
VTNKHTAKLHLLVPLYNISKINVEEITRLLAEDSDGEKSPTVSSPQQSPIKVKGNRSRKLNFPPIINSHLHQ